jgi:hypothetical protein
LVLVSGRNRPNSVFACHGLAVDRKVDSPPQLEIVPEERSPRVEVEQPDAVPRNDEELRLVDAVPLRQLIRPVGDRPERDESVGSAGRNLIDCGASVYGEVEDEPVDVMWSLPVVEAVPFEHDALIRDVRGDVVRRRARQRRLRAPRGQTAD